MNLISYAQNFEDVMLWRALSHVEGGFFIDIGAQDPLVDSVSLLFRERGWRGIHLEASPQYAELLRAARPGDIVIQAAVSNSSDPLQFFEIPGGGISTAHPDVAQQHIARGIAIREIIVPSVKLAAVFDLVQSDDVHWLKIDVEGFEEQVLASWGSSPMRPWIVVIESTLPLTQIETHTQWEHILLSYGYRHAYFDGLNRYYVSEQHLDLIQAFKSPPNVFDDFKLNGTSTAPFHKHIVSRYERLLEEQSTRYSLQKSARDEEFYILQSEIAAREKLTQEQAGRIDDLSTRLRILSESVAQREKEFGAQIASLHARATETLQEYFRDRDNREAQLRRAHETERTEAQTASNERLAALQSEIFESQRRIAQIQSRLLEATQQWADQRDALKDSLNRQTQIAQRHIETSRKLKAALTEIRSSITWKVLARMRVVRTEALNSEAFVDHPDQFLDTSEIKTDKTIGANDAPASASSRMAINILKDDQMKLPTSTSLAALLRYEDDEFLEQAYRAILRREPDDDGRNFYSGRLRNGISKLQVLTEIYGSSEARSISPTIPGISNAIRLQKLSALPLIGFMFRPALTRYELQIALDQQREVEKWTIAHIESLARRVSALEGRRSAHSEVSMETGGAVASQLHSKLGSILEKRVTFQEEEPMLVMENFKSSVSDSLESRALRVHKR